MVHYNRLKQYMGNTENLTPGGNKVAKDDDGNPDCVLINCPWASMWVGQAPGSKMGWRAQEMHTRLSL